MKEAQRLDDHLENTGEVVGPMHGIPMSIKVYPLLQVQADFRTSSM